MEEIKNKLKELLENREKLSINTFPLVRSYSLVLFLTIKDFSELLGADAIKEKLDAIFTTDCNHCRELTF